MVLYPYVAGLAFDGMTGEKAANATGQVFAKSDSSFMNPLPTVDASGLPIALTSNNDGILPTFFVDGNTAVNWKSGDWVFPLVTSEPIPGPPGLTGAASTVPGPPGEGIVTPEAVAANLPVRLGVSELDATSTATLIDAGLIPRAPMDTPPKTTFEKAQGLSVAALATGGTGYAIGDEIVLAGGTNSYPAIVKVATVSGSAILTVTRVVAGIYTVTPTAPVAQASTTGAGTGATFTPSWSGDPSHLRNRVSVGATDAAFRFTGLGPGDKGGGYYGNTVGNATASLWEWETDSAEIDLQLGGTNMITTLYINGQRVSLTQITTDASGARYMYDLNFGDAKQLRSYRLHGVNTAFHSIGIIAGGVIRQPSKIKPLAWGLGDSYMFGNGATNISMAAFNIMCEQLGWEGLPDGVGGSGWTGGTAGLPAARVNAKLAPLVPRKPDYVILDMGLNNAMSDVAAVKTGFNDAVAAVQTAAPLAKIIVFGPATPLGETTQLAGIKTALQERCAALSLTFIDVANWVNLENKSRYTDADNTHPTPLGHIYIGARKAGAIRRVIVA